MALDPTYQNRLKALLQDPSSFSLSPDAQVGMQYGQQALNASNSGMRGSGNALQALVKYGNDTAQADYGNQVSRLGALSGQAQNYDLGQVQNANSATRNANDLSLGQQQNANQRYGIDQSTALGYTNAANTRYGIDQNFALGQGQLANTAQRNANDFGLGAGQLGNTAQNNWWNYQLGQGQNANQAAGIFANYDLGQGRNAVDWYNAGTNRGGQQSNAWNQGQTTAQNWYRTLPHSTTDPGSGTQFFNAGGR